MDDKAPPIEPTAKETTQRISLAILKTNFETLDKFVAELTSDGASMPISLTKSDLDDLLSVSLELQDAANNLEFEARKIHDKLRSIIV